MYFNISSMSKRLFYRYAVPGPCKPIAVGKTLIFDEAKKSPPLSRPRKLSTLNSKIATVDSDSDNLFEMDSDDLDGDDEKENCETTMELDSDYQSPVMRSNKSKMPKSKLNFS